MSDADLRLKCGTLVAPEQPKDPATSAGRNTSTPRSRTKPIVITLGMVALALLLGWTVWGTYMEAPWTRDGTLRAYVVVMAPEVSGRIISVPVADNQFVHKGDLLMVIDPTDYRIAVRLAMAAVRQAEANAQNTQREALRREKLSDAAAISVEQVQIYDTQAFEAETQLEQAQASLEQAQVRLRRTEIRSPVNGWVTNLLTQLGDYATVGQNAISVIDADSFWIDGYFAESKLATICVGDPAKIKLMAYRQILDGRVGSVAHGINVANAQPNEQGLAQVNPIFTWVRLAQRIPVRIQIENVPKEVKLVAGMTATVQIGVDSGSRLDSILRIAKMNIRDTSTNDACPSSTEPFAPAKPKRSGSRPHQKGRP